MRFFLVYYIVSIFMLANGAMFTWLFQILHFPVWRQAIWGVGLIYLFKYARRTHSALLKKYLRDNAIFFYIVILLSLLTILLEHFNIVRIVYAWWMYFSGLPFLLFPFVATQEGWSESKVNYFFIGLGTFLSIGLIIDYMTGGMFTSMFLLQTSSDLSGLLESGRYCFLSEAPTTFGVYYAFCMVFCIRQLSTESRTHRQLILMFITLLYILGAWFTGSRQIVAVLLLVFLPGILWLFFKGKRNKIAFGVLFFILLSVVPAVKVFIFSDDSYQERYSSESVKEDIRYTYWERGFRESITEAEPKRLLIGDAVAKSQGQKAKEGELTGSHYENTFWSRMSEMGLVGLFMFCYPVIFLLKYMNYKLLDDLLILAVMVVFLFISYVSPNGIHQTSQMVLNLGLGLFMLNKDGLIPRKSI